MAIIGISKISVPGSNPGVPATIQNFPWKIFTLLWRLNFVKDLLRHAFVMFYTYILQSLKNRSLYIGYTTNLKKRFKEHNNGRSAATKTYLPYKLIFYEAFLNQNDAKNRELYLKSGWGFRSIRKLLKNYLN